MRSPWCVLTFLYLGAAATGCGGGNGPTDGGGPPDGGGPIGGSGVGVVSGTISDAFTHVPVVGAAVSIEGTTTQSGSDGRFELTDVSAGRRTLSATKSGYVGYNSTFIVEAGQSVT